MLGMYCLSDVRTIERAILSRPLDDTSLGNLLFSGSRYTYEYIGNGLKRVAERSFTVSDLLPIQRGLFKEAQIAHRVCLLRQL